MDSSEQLTLDSLVTLQSDVEPYLLDWPAVGASSVSETLVLVVMLRPGGFLAAVPVGFIPSAVLEVGNGPSPPGPVGPSTVVSVPGAVLDNGTLSPTGSPLAVTIVDFSQSLVSQLRVLPPFHEAQFGFDPEQPFAIPSPIALAARVKEWLEAGGESGTLGYATAFTDVDDLDGQELEEGDLPDGDLPPEQSTPPRTPKPRKPARRTVPGPERPSTAEKRPTVASLAGSLQELIQVNTGLSQQVQSLTLRQQELERKAMISSQTLVSPQAMLRQPISAALATQTAKPSAVAQTIGAPPRTAVSMTPGLLQSPLVKPPDLLELEEEKGILDPSSSGDPLALAVLQQSRALTALVNQIASQSTDPLLDLGSGSFGASTRGAQGRAKLQAELAAQRGSFFSAVLASMARRMQPTMSAEGSPEELMNRGVSGTRYLERFGGFGKHRELGCLQFQVMTIMDFLQVGNLPAARDAVSLLAVTIDQAALDNGRFDLANLLSLQEDPPSTVFTHKAPNVLSKARAFTPLASQQWITVALAYVKELDLISAKRLEMASFPKPNPFASSSQSAEAPKPKAAPKKKGKGGGKGGATAQQNQEVEE